MRSIRNAGAFLLAIADGIRYGTNDGRTWADNHDRNEAYDNGLNFVDWLLDR